MEKNFALIGEREDFNGNSTRREEKRDNFRRFDREPRELRESRELRDHPRDHRDARDSRELKGKSIEKENFLIINYLQDVMKEKERWRELIDVNEKLQKEVLKRRMKKNAPFPRNTPSILKMRILRVYQVNMTMGARIEIKALSLL
jgi:hypothetical protein